ncbi:MAG: hypothetical protein J6B06_02015 [Lachnospiraceae bacterium]|nr:hypothetical protein [Lachnospiraceae bacterium]
MQEKNWSVGVDIGVRVTQISYMTDGMKEPETLEELFPTGEDEGFLKECLLAIPGLENLSEIKSIQLVLPELTLEKAEKAGQACLDMGIPREAVHVQGVAEASIYFALSQEKSLWNNDVVFFDFSREGMIYRNLHIEKYGNTTAVILTEKKLSGIDYENPSDEEFLRLSREYMDRRLISAVYLIGEGFYKEEWATESLRFLCSRRRVFKGLNLYTKGAAYAAYDRIHMNAYEQFLFVCENRLWASVGIRILYKEQARLLYLAKAGMNWYEARALIEAIPDEVTELSFVVQTLNGRETEEKLSLEAFPARGRRMTRLEISLVFVSEEHGIVTVRDLGFGSFIPAEDISVQKDIWIDKGQ